jgi:small conductance mechanosensitive channel
MKMKFVTGKWLLWSVTSLTLISTLAVAAECPADIEAVTSSEAEVPVEVLAHRVAPLTRCELETEAQAWLLLLQKKVQEISDAEIAALYKKEEITKAEEAENALEEVQEAREEADREEIKEATQEAKDALEEAEEAEQKTTQDTAAQQAIEAATSKAEDKGEIVTAAAKTTEGKADLRTALVKHVSDLRTERTVLIDRFNVVLTELRAKGGETQEFDSYIEAVSGIKVDVTDASATWTTISGWLMSPEGGFRWAFNIAQFIAIVIVFYLLSILAGKAAQKASSRSARFSSLLRDFLVLGARRLVLFIGFFVGLSALETVASSC